MKNFWYLYAIIGVIVADFFGITLGMGTACLIPVSLIAIGLFAHQHMNKNLSAVQALLNGGLPPLVGGLMVWMCFLLKNLFNVTTW